MKSNSNQDSLSRRNLLKLSVGFIGANSVSGWLANNALAENVEKNTSAHKPLMVAANKHDEHHDISMITPQEALKKLMEGNERFVKNKRSYPDQNMARINEVAMGQNPFAAILSCADSRVIPEIAFDQGIGDLFVVRVAGNLAMTEAIASEEYAVGVLKSSLLMVLGHERCGAVTAAIEGGELPGIIESLLYTIQPAVEYALTQKGDRLTNTIKANVRFQVAQLKTSSVIASAIKQGKLMVVGAFYDLDTGRITLVD